MDAVKFYSVEDLAAGYYLKKAEQIIYNYDLKFIKDSNEALELFNSTLYIENGMYLQEWTEENILYLNEKSRKIKKNLGCYMAGIQGENIESYAADIHWIYKEDFLTLFCKYKLSERISDSVFESLLKKKFFSVTTVLKFKYLVDHYESVIKNIFLENPLNAELLLSQYRVEKNSLQLKKLYFPKSLTKLELNTLIDSYIKMEEANLNYLRLIVNNHNTKEFSVTDEQKLNAKRRIKEKEEMFFKEGNGVGFGYKIIFQRNLSEPVIETLEGTELSITFDKSWLEENLDYATILQNFIWIFNFIDGRGRITFVSRPSDISAFENVAGLKSKRDYKKGLVFNSKEIKSDLMIEAYYRFLKDGKINLEKVIEWFFTEYLNQEFGVEQYYATSPSEGTSYREKCRDILPAMEYSLMQFKSYADEGFINHELLEISNSGLLFEQIPSLVKKKYVYPAEGVNLPSYYLFSDQSGMGYLNNPEKDSPNFFELMIKCKINYSEFYKHQQLGIDRLCELGYVKVETDGLINWSNEKRVKILYELYYNEVLSYYRMHSQLRDEIDFMHRENLLRFESSLFSRSEQDYFNYYLNNSTFQNGPQLRNKYAHGRLGSRPTTDELIHQQNYLVIIKLFLLAVLKINEDFCLSDIAKKLEN